MKTIKRIGIGLVSLTMIIIGSHLYFLSTLTATETYPSDSYLATVTKKRALVVVAHDDDACAAAGTIAKLNKAGWKIKQVSFQDGDKNRATVYQKAAAVVMSEQVSFINASNEAYRTDQENKRPYMPIAKSEFHDLFKYDQIAQKLEAEIRSFQPTVIIAFDNQVGGYGHPDHVLTGQLVIDLCQNKDLGVQRIYQPVYPASMEKSILVEWTNMWNRSNVYQEACKVYNEPEGMPTPTCSIDIYSVASDKMDYLTSLRKKEQKNIKKFLPGYQYYPSWVYFWLFDKEYFHVIKL